MKHKIKCVLTCLMKTHEPILLDNKRTVTLGRSALTKIKDKRCSKNQIELTADYDEYKIKYKHLGSNEGSINGVIIKSGESRYLNHKDKIEFLNGQFPHEILFDPEPLSSSYDLETISDKNDDDKGTNSSDKGDDRLKRKRETLDDFVSKKPRENIPEGEWEDFFDGDLLTYNKKELEGSKIASFDMDHTLITTVSGNVFPKNKDDWRLMYADIPNKLRKVHEDGYSIIIFTNQAGIGTGKTPLKDIQTKISRVVEKLNVPLQVLVSTGKGKYRKPIPGMWDFLMEKCGNGREVDKEKSFYVGDAAGRPEIPKQRKKDHSVADRLFALNIGLKFYTPEEYFLGDKPSTCNMPEFDPREVSSSVPLYDPPATSVPDNPLEVILLVGFPGSGKSFFVEKHLLKLGYIPANRDTIGSWQKCVNLMEKSLKENKSVVIDNTNPDKSSRARYIEAAKKLNVPVRCFVFNTSLNQCKHNNKFREITGSEHSKVGTMIYNMFKSKYEEPELKEGFSDIVKVNFLPSFKNEEMEQLYKLYLLES